MKLPYRLRYAVTFLASVALTFHFLQSRSLVDSSNQGKREPGENRLQLKSGFQVLQGNVTVHVGEEIANAQPVFLVNARSLCSDFIESKLKLLIFVASSAGNEGKRQGIRDTWGSRSLQLALNFRVVFILGRSDAETIAKESVRYGDIVQIDTGDTFQNLGFKSAAGLIWSTDYCPNADFIMKTDDDILVHVPNLIQVLESAKDPETLLLCHENRMRKILRKSSLDVMPKHYGKYEVPENEVPGVYYPPYCSGLAYVFSSGVRDRLQQASAVTPVFFIEDVYLTGFCRHKAGVLITPADGITLRPPITQAQAACSFKDGRITSHEVGVQELRALWAEINTQGFFCPKLVGYALPRQNADVSAREQQDETLRGMAHTRGGFES